MHRTPARSTVLLASLALSLPACGQSLARPGWAGSGITTDAWWKHPVIYEIDTRSFQDSNGDGTGDLKGIAERLDYIQSLGTDAILLDPLQAAQSPQQVDPALGTLDDFDNLSLEASRRNIRIVLSLPQPDAATARFWLNRGVAGLHPVPIPIPVPAAGPAPTGALPLADLRRLLASYPGQRILVGEGDAAQLQLNPSVLLTEPTGSQPADLRSAARIRTALAAALASGASPPPPNASGASSAVTPSQRLRPTAHQAPPAALPVLLSDAPGTPRSVDRYGDGKHDFDIAKLIATVLLGTRSAVLIDDGQEIGLSGPTAAAPAMLWGDAPTSPATEPAPEASKPPQPFVRKPAPKPAPETEAAQDVDPQSLLNFYRSLAQLHHGTNAMGSGDIVLLNHDTENVLAWVRRPKSVSLLNPAIVVLCNFSGAPVTFSLKAEMASLHLRGSFLRAVLRSDAAMGSKDLDHATLAPYAVYIGELRY